MIRAGILPSNSTTYTLSSLQTALLSQTGAIPYLGCTGSNNTILDEVWYFNHVLGTEQFGRYKPVNSTTASTCAEDRIRYLERAPGSEQDVGLVGFQ